MIDGIITPAIRDINYLAPCAPYPAIPSGITIHENTIYRYAIPTDEQPTLSIIDYIPDYNGNFIKPGHYQLALSDDKEFLYLIESKNLIAVIPVFKLAENKDEVEKSRKKQEKHRPTREEKFQKIIDIKFAKTGATPPPKEYIHMEASIDYIKEGGYYLIRYEKGFIRAWGAIKAVQ